MLSTSLVTGRDDDDDDEVRWESVCQGFDNLTLASRRLYRDSGALLLHRNRKVCRHRQISISLHTISSPETIFHWP